MIFMDTVAHLVMWNVLFDVDGKRFYLYSSAIKHYDENNSKEINALNFFAGWHCIAER